MLYLADRTARPPVKAPTECSTEESDVRLCRFEILNFKGIQSASFNWVDIVLLIGENNAGKSTVLQALQYFLSGSQIKDDQLFYNNLTDVGNAMELIGHFSDLSQSEQQSTAVRGRML